ncbi:SDR family NAD(P)-dependent oxidoreductase [Amycolatopsis albispora]|uniref:Short-chain dehydrogenase n=1 Tax=Amycolatopsis albispora TaxID=1804986 RepID=A0A344LER6_9PSEU|nr:SDR family oxidoreductase [Amycolatopsis albispora]AXB46540.1 short-chain dehydrogenase [Amycolatopsis albispora]
MIDTGLAGRVVLVTGAHSGIGAAIARAFGAEGARVASHYLGEQDAPPDGVQWAHSVGPVGSVEGEGFQADLADDEASVRLLDRVEARLGPVDVLVNNAAHCETPDTIETINGGSLSRHYWVNAIAPALLTAELARRHRGGRPPCVVNISTDAARAFPGQLGYGTSKAALEAFTRAAALDLAASGIRVNAVAPGPVQTGWMDDELLGEVRRIVPLGREGTPEDIADAVVFLASHQARWITGQVVQVAGGHAL